MLFGDVGLVTCLPGFTLSSGVKCGADADFVPVGSLPVCSPRSCGVPPEVSGASRSAEEVLFQGHATYTCDRGYIVGGSFSQADVVCLPRPCGGPPLAQSASPSDVAVLYGQSVTFSCDPGYAINPRDVPSTTSQLSCKENGVEPSAPESCSPVVCNKPDFENAERSTVSVGCHEEVSRFQWISLDAGNKYTCQAGFTTTGETSGATSASAVCGASGDVKPEGSLKSLPTVICQRVRCVTPATVIHAELQLHDDGRKAVYTTSDNETTFETRCEATGHFPFRPSLQKC